MTGECVAHPQLDIKALGVPAEDEQAAPAREATALSGSGKLSSSRRAASFVGPGVWMTRWVVTSPRSR